MLKIKPQTFGMNMYQLLPLLLQSLMDFVEFPVIFSFFFKPKALDLIHLWHRQALFWGGAGHTQTMTAHDAHAWGSP